MFRRQQRNAPCRRGWRGPAGLRDAPPYGASQVRIVKEQNRINDQLSIYMNSCQGVETLFSAPLPPRSGDGRPKWFPGKSLRRLRKSGIREEYPPLGSGRTRGAYSGSAWRWTPDIRLDDSLSRLVSS